MTSHHKILILRFWSFTW